MATVDHYQSTHNTYDMDPFFFRKGSVKEPAESLLIVEELEYALLAVDEALEELARLIYRLRTHHEVR